MVPEFACRRVRSGEPAGSASLRPLPRDWQARHLPERSDRIAAVQQTVSPTSPSTRPNHPGAAGTDLRPPRRGRRAVRAWRIHRAARAVRAGRAWRKRSATWPRAVTPASFRDHAGRSGCCSRNAPTRSADLMSGARLHHRRTRRTRSRGRAVAGRVVAPERIALLGRSAAARTSEPRSSGCARAVRRSRRCRPMSQTRQQVGNRRWCDRGARAGVAVGAIHAAGLLDDAMPCRARRGTLRARARWHRRPAVPGTCIVDCDRARAILALFSSSSAARPGPARPTTPPRMPDSIARWRGWRVARGARGRSINRGPGGEIGMAAQSERRGARPSPTDRAPHGARRRARGFRARARHEQRSGWRS